MTRWFFLIFCVLTAVLALLFVTQRRVRISLSALMLFLLSVGGFFLLFNNVLLWTVYLVAAATILFLIYSYVSVFGYELHGPTQKPLKFYHIVIFVTVVLYLFLIFSALMFTSRSHELADSAVYGAGWIHGGGLAGTFISPLVLVVVAFLFSALGAISVYRKDG